MDVAKQQWKCIGPSWGTRRQDNTVIYVHIETQKALEAWLEPVENLPADGQTPEALLRFHIRKRNRAFHLGQSALEKGFVFDSEKDQKEFIHMTEYLDHTHGIFGDAANGFFGWRKEKNRWS